MPAAPDSVRFEAGQLIGEKYRLVRQIDEGGMGTVWEAVNADLDHLVAVKLMRAELAESAAADRLIHEARVLARLVHPSIIRVFDCGRTKERIPFIVMELLTGECLADTLDREGSLDPKQAVRLLLPVAEAIQVVHERGVIHRDLKPENIYLARMAGGHLVPKVLDFGIALSDSNQDLRLTTDGSLLGSPQYMSPEQARGERALDNRSDVWAYTVVLYECIAGKSPFRRENYHQTLRAIIEEEPPSLVELGLGDALLGSIVERGLRKDRERRWSSLRELGTALAEWLLTQGVEEDAARVSLRSVWLDPAISSLPPVALPPSDPPPSGSKDAPTLDAAALALTDQPSTTGPVRRPSTGGLSLTAHGAPRSRVRRALALGGMTLLLATGALWWTARGASTPSGVLSVSAAPLPAPSPAIPVSAAVRAPDAGAKPAPEPRASEHAAREDEAPAPAPKAVRRPPHRRVAPVSRAKTDLKNPY
jgi:eukaryotic-like serine/threonine-protein kinase